ncbi:MAG: nucleotidyltransferase family protein [Desulfomonile tiedjei]|nr:nucleotidyltransferase family protein [Desulfomonile tiedjei]
MTHDLSGLCIGQDSSVRQAMQQIDLNAKQIVLVCEEERLLGTITDGDIRRAILEGMDLDTVVSSILKLKKTTLHSGPISALLGTDPLELLRLMRKHGVRHIPLLDADGRVRELATMDDLVPEECLPLQAVIMAGGYGRRLRPLTEHLPKPMLLVGDRPLLQRIIERLREAGVSRISLTTHYKGQVIEDHFGDGRGFGVDISYVHEEQPMGTAGALRLLDEPDQPLLVINGDILTTVDFRAMFAFHREHEAYMTVAVKQIEFGVPYGVLETNGSGVTGIIEKPVLRHFVNAGIFLLNPEACKVVPADQPYDMPELINRLLEKNLNVVAFPIREYWLDIGQLDHYQKALDDVGSGEVS